MEQLDAIYDVADTCFHDGKFDDFDAMLENADVKNSDTDVLLGMLTASLPAKSKLPSRPRFFADVGSELRKRGEYEEGILSGLE